MKYYIVVFADPGEDLRNKEVLLVHKDRPAWQAGRFNLVGGKLEEGEFAIFGGVRELKEESGLSPTDHPMCKGTIFGTESTIYVIHAPVDRTQPIQPRPGETEVVEWHNWAEMEKDPRMLPNLRLMVPYLQSGINGIFSLQDYEPYDLNKPVHPVTFSFTRKEGEPIHFKCGLGDPSQPIISIETGQSFMELLAENTQ